MRFEARRSQLARWLIRWVIVPLVGRPVQIIRQDERVGGLHHAPMCGANHYHHQRPLTTRCTCGAVGGWMGPRDSKPMQPQQQIDPRPRGDRDPRTDWGKPEQRQELRP